MQYNILCSFCVTIKITIILFFHNVTMYGLHAGKCVQMLRLYSWQTFVHAVYEFIDWYSFVVADKQGVY